MNLGAYLRKFHTLHVHVFGAQHSAIHCLSVIIVVTNFATTGFAVANVGLIFLRAPLQADMICKTAAYS